MNLGLECVLLLLLCQIDDFDLFDLFLELLHFSLSLARAMLEILGTFNNAAQLMGDDFDFG